MLQIEHGLAIHVNSALMVRLKFIDGLVGISEKVPRKRIVSNRVLPRSLIRRTVLRTEPD